MPSGTPSRARWHVLYWEDAQFEGIKLDAANHTRERRKREGPAICDLCNGVADAWRFRMDNVQATLRICMDATGERFREDFVDFVCLSPYMSIVFNTRDFQRHLTNEGRAALSEECVIGTAIRVHRGDLPPRGAGVEAVEFPAPASGEGTAWRHEPWLRKYVRSIRAAAAAAGGAALCLMLDVHGLEVVNLGVATPFFSHDPNRPIREVVILLGGPSGIDKKALEQLQGVLNDKDGGLDGGTFAIKLPGGKQHSCVALGELLALHDGGRLLPMLEDWRLLGTARYGDWVRRAREALCGVAGARRGAAAKTRAVEAWRGRALRSAGSPVPGLERAAPAALPAAREATPAEVWRRVALLEQQGLLPHRRSWRLRMSLQAAPPHLAIAELARFEHTARAAASCGAPLEDPSVDLAELLDSLAQSAPREERARHTERAVLEALAARSGRGVRAADHRALGRLPCSRALRLLEELEGGPLEGRIPAAVEEHLAALEALDDWEAQGGGAPRQRVEDGGASSEAAEAEEEEGESHGWRSGQPDAPAAEGPQQPCMPPPQRLLRERGGGRGWQQGGRQPWKQQRRG